MSGIDLLCIGLIAAGTLLVLWNKKRRYLRSNWVGIEQFRSFGQKLLAKMLDELLLATGYGCLGGSLIILLFEHAFEYVLLAALLAIALMLDDEWHQRRCSSRKK